MKNYVNSEKFEVVFHSYQVLVIHRSFSHDDATEDEDQSLSHEANVSPNMMDGMLTFCRDSYFAGFGHE